MQRKVRYSKHLRPPPPPLRSSCPHHPRISATPLSSPPPTPHPRPYLLFPPTHTPISPSQFPRLPAPRPPRSSRNTRCITALITTPYSLPYVSIFQPKNRLPSTNNALFRAHPPCPPQQLPLLQRSWTQYKTSHAAPSRGLVPAYLTPVL